MYGRVLFIGNSITLHLPAPDIGWTGNRGMAASLAERDYVHLVTAGLKETEPELRSGIVQLADWERSYSDSRIYEKYAGERDKKPGLVIVRLGENVADDGFEPAIFTECFTRMVRFFAPDDARVIIAGSFWDKREVDKSEESAARTLGAEFLTLRDLGADREMTAAGLFAHPGVAAHPGDRGMEAIASRLLSLCAARG